MATSKTKRTTKKGLRKPKRLQRTQTLGIVGTKGGIPKVGGG